MHDDSPRDHEANLRVLQEQLAMQSVGSISDAVLASAASSRLNLLETMMEAVPVGIVLADSRGRIIHGNSCVEAMLRHPVLFSESTDDYGEWVSFHEDGRRVASEEYPLSRVLRDGEENAELDVNYQRGDGTRFWLRIIGKPVKDREGRTIGATVALVDIDEERRLQKIQKVLIGELNHRVKNAFAVVKSIVAQSLRGTEMPESLRTTLDERLNAYAAAHSRLVGNQWDNARLDEIAEQIVGPIGNGRVTISGPPLSLPTRQGLAFSMAFYELTTNALKYGALSVPEGQVDLCWEIAGSGDQRRLAVRWQETGGPHCSEPNRKGFGSFVTGRALAAETGGKVDAQFHEGGLRWNLDMPLNDILNEND